MDEKDMLVPLKQLNAMAHHLVDNAKKADLESKSKTDMVFGLILGAMNSYLFLLRENKLDPEKYETVKTALQEIVGWFIMGLNIETFEFDDSVNNNDRQLIFNVDVQK